MATSDSSEPPFDVDDAAELPPRGPAHSGSRAVYTYEPDDGPGDASRQAVTIIEPPMFVGGSRSRARGGFFRRPLALAFAAAFGAVIGAFVPGMIGGGPSVAGADTDGSAPLRESIDTLAGELSALKTTIAASRRDSEAKLADLAERFTKVENAQDGFGSTLSALAETTVREANTPSPEVTGSVTPVRDLPVARGWVLWRVTNGRAVVEHRGRYYEVEPGSDIPGLGMVEAIERQAGRWHVVTRGGVIHQPRG